MPNLADVWADAHLDRDAIRRDADRITADLQRVAERWERIVNVSGTVDLNVRRATTEIERAAVRWRRAARVAGRVDVVTAGTTREIEAAALRWQRAAQIEAAVTVDSTQVTAEIAARRARWDALADVTTTITLDNAGQVTREVAAFAELWDRILRLEAVFGIDSAAADREAAAVVARWQAMAQITASIDFDDEGITEQLAAAVTRWDQQADFAANVGLTADNNDAATAQIVAEVATLAASIREALTLRVEADLTDADREVEASTSRWRRLTDVVANIRLAPQRVTQQLASLVAEWNMRSYVETDVRLVETERVLAELRLFAERARTAIDLRKRVEIDDDAALTILSRLSRRAADIGDIELAVDVTEVQQAVEQVRASRAELDALLDRDPRVEVFVETGRAARNIEQLADAIQTVRDRIVVGADVVGVEEATEDTLTLQALLDRLERSYNVRIDMDTATATAALRAAAGRWDTAADVDSDITVRSGPATAEVLRLAERWRRILVVEAAVNTEVNQALAELTEARGQWDDLVDVTATVDPGGISGATAELRGVAAEWEEILNVDSLIDVDAARATADFIAARAALEEIGAISMRVNLDADSSDLVDNAIEARFGRFTADVNLELEPGALLARLAALSRAAEAIMRVEAQVDLDVDTALTRLAALSAAVVAVPDVTVGVDSDGIENADLPELPAIGPVQVPRVRVSDVFEPDVLDGSPFRELTTGGDAQSDLFARLGDRLGGVFRDRFQRATESEGGFIDFGSLGAWFRDLGRRVRTFFTSIETGFDELPLDDDVTRTVRFDADIASLVADGSRINGMLQLMPGRKTVEFDAETAGFLTDLARIRAAFSDVKAEWLDEDTLVTAFDLARIERDLDAFSRRPVPQFDIEGFPSAQRQLDDLKESVADFHAQWERRMAGRFSTHNVDVAFARIRRNANELRRIQAVIEPTADTSEAMTRLASLEAFVEGLNQHAEVTVDFDNLQLIRKIAETNAEIDAIRTELGLTLDDDTLFANLRLLQARLEAQEEQLRIDIESGLDRADLARSIAEARATLDALNFRLEIGTDVDHDNLLNSVIGVAQAVGNIDGGSVKLTLDTDDIDAEIERLGRPPSIGDRVERLLTRDVGSFDPFGMGRKFRRLFGGSGPEDGAARAAGRRAFSRFSESLDRLEARLDAVAARARETAADVAGGDTGEGGFFRFRPDFDGFVTDADRTFRRVHTSIVRHVDTPFGDFDARLQTITARIRSVGTEVERFGQQATRAIGPASQIIDVEDVTGRRAIGPPPRRFSFSDTDFDFDLPRIEVDDIVDAEVLDGSFVDRIGDNGRSRGWVLSSLGQRLGQLFSRAFARNSRSQSGMFDFSGISRGFRNIVRQAGEAASRVFTAFNRRRGGQGGFIDFRAILNGFRGVVRAAGSAAGSLFSLFRPGGGTGGRGGGVLGNLAGFAASAIRNLRSLGSVLGGVGRALGRVRFGEGFAAIGGALATIGGGAAKALKPLAAMGALFVKIAGLAALLLPVLAALVVVIGQLAAALTGVLGLAAGFLTIAASVGVLAGAAGALGFILNPDLIADAKEQFGLLKNEVGDLFRPVAQNIQDQFQRPLLNALGGLAAVVAPMANSFLDPIANAAVVWIGDLSRALADTTLFAQFGEGIGSIIQLLGDYLGPFVEAIEGVSDDSFAGIEGFIRTLLDVGLQFVEPWREFILIFANGESAFTGIFNALNQVTTVLLHTINQLITSPAFNGYVQTLIAGFTTAAQVTQQTFDQLLRDGTIQQALQGFSTLFVGAAEILPKFAGALTSLFGGLAPLFDGLMSGFGILFDGISAFAQTEGFERLSELLGFLIEQVGVLASGILSGLGEALGTNQLQAQDALEGTKLLLEEIAALGPTLGLALGSAFILVLDVLALLGHAVGHVGSALLTLIAQIGGFFSGLFRGAGAIADWIGADGIAEDLRGVADTLDSGTETIRNARDNFNEKVDSLGEGADAARAKLDELGTGASNAAHGLDDVADAAFRGTAVFGAYKSAVASLGDSIDKLADKVKSPLAFDLSEVIEVPDTSDALQKGIDAQLKKVNEAARKAHDKAKKEFDKLNRQGSRLRTGSADPEFFRSLGKPAEFPDGDEFPEFVEITITTMDAAIDQLVKSIDDATRKNQAVLRATRLGYDDLADLLEELTVEGFLAIENSLKSASDRELAGFDKRIRDARDKANEAIVELALADVTGTFEDEINKLDFLTRLADPTQGGAPELALALFNIPADQFDAVIADLTDEKGKFEPKIKTFEEKLRAMRFFFELAIAQAKEKWDEFKALVDEGLVLDPITGVSIRFGPPVPTAPVNREEAEAGLERALRLIGHAVDDSPINEATKQELLDAIRNATNVDPVMRKVFDTIEQWATEAPDKFIAKVHHLKTQLHQGGLGIDLFKDFKFADGSGVAVPPIDTSGVDDAVAEATVKIEEALGPLSEPKDLTLPVTVNASVGEIVIPDDLTEAFAERGRELGEVFAVGVGEGMAVISFNPELSPSEKARIAAEDIERMAKGLPPIDRRSDVTKSRLADVFLAPLKDTGFLQELRGVGRMWADQIVAGIEEGMRSPQIGFEFPEPREDGTQTFWEGRIPEGEDPLRGQRGIAGVVLRAIADLSDKMAEAAEDMAERFLRAFLTEFAAVALVVLPSIRAIGEAFGRAFAEGFNSEASIDVPKLPLPGGGASGQSRGGGGGRSRPNVGGPTGELGTVALPSVEVNLPPRVADALARGMIVTYLAAVNRAISLPFIRAILLLQGRNFAVRFGQGFATPPLGVVNFAAFAMVARYVQAVGRTIIGFLATLLTLQGRLFANRFGEGFGTPTQAVVDASARSMVFAYVGAVGTAVADETVTSSMFTNGEVVGQAFGDGLIEGLRLTEPGVVAAAGSLADEIRLAMEERLQIKSPSRVARGIGGYVGEGVALGLDASAPKVASAAAGLAELALPYVGRVNLGDPYFGQPHIDQPFPAAFAESQGPDGQPVVAPVVVHVPPQRPNVVVASDPTLLAEIRKLRQALADQEHLHFEAGAVVIERRHDSLVATDVVRGIRSLRYRKPGGRP